MRRGCDSSLKRGKKMKSAIKLLASLSLLVACVPTTPEKTSGLTFTPSPTLIPSQSPVPSETPTLPLTFAPTVTSTLTSTPQPPLVSHEWNPEIVLISVDERGGDGGWLIGDNGLRKFVLYYDGSLFLTRSLMTDHGNRTQMLYKRLTREEICQHLNTLDQIGFLDYDPESYHFNEGRSLVTGARSTYLEVYSWKTTIDRYYGLNVFLQEEIVDEYYHSPGYPEISPALRNAYYFLYHYPEAGFEVYQPERIGIWIYDAEEIYRNAADFAREWSLQRTSLKALFEEGGTSINDKNQRYLVLNGSRARAIYDFVGQTYSYEDVFFEDYPDGSKKYYVLFARPLLPYELPVSNSASQIPAPYFPKPDTKLSCHPSDGILPIPTPPTQ